MAGEGDPARAPDADVYWSSLVSATHTVPAHTSKCPLLGITPTAEIPSTL